MDGKVNAYYNNQIDDDAIRKGAHRGFVGGMWDLLGQLQFDFMINAGLKPHHRFLDVGCGCLRGGIKFIEYLEPGNYYGLDINASLLKAGEHELTLSQLDHKLPTLVHDENFSFDKLGNEFDFLLAISVFTHLPINNINHCLAKAVKVMGTESRFYATYFEAPSAVFFEKIAHQPGDIITNYDSDPFHNSFSEYQWMAEQNKLTVTNIGNWEHPRNQKMLEFKVN